MTKIEHLVFFVLLISAQHITPALCRNIQRAYPEGNDSVVIPEGWVQSDLKATSDTDVRFVIGLKLQNEEQLLEKFWSVSDPDHPDYGKYMTLEEITSLVAPLDSHIEVVRSWLEAHGVTSIDSIITKDYLIAVAPVRVVEKMFQVTLRYFDNAYDDRRVLRSSMPYSVPAELSSAIDIVFGLTNFPATTLPIIHSSKRNTHQFAPAVYPNNIKRVLHIGDVVGSGRDDNVQAVVEFVGQYYNPADLVYFLNYFGLPNQTISNVIGYNDPTNAGEEATLDVQYIVGIGTNVSTWFYSIPAPSTDPDPFLDWLLLMSNETQIPNVISVSYGGAENSFTLQSVTRCNVEFVKAGLRGSTILFASGDSGVGCNANCTSFVPNWPASSPYVTAVGGAILDKESPFAVEGDSISGGGFSSYFGVPKYQKNAVASYIAKSKLPPTSFYNISGRGIPDLAGFSENVVIFMGGGEVGAAGTSCSAPITAGVLSLINDALLQKGKPPLGFFNQLLYKLTPKYPNAIYDVKIGVPNGYECCSGFSCATGWDPVTGLGITMFTELRDAIFKYLQYV